MKLHTITSVDHVFDKENVIVDLNKSEPTSHQLNLGLLDMGIFPMPDLVAFSNLFWLLVFTQVIPLKK